MRRLLAWCLLIAWPIPTGAVSPAATTPFVSTSQRGIVVSVRVNGLGPYPFLLDTGATHTLVAEDLVEATGAPLVAKAMVGSVLGATMRPIARLDRLELGPLVARNIEPSVLPRTAMDLADGAQGVIGQDVLAPLRYTIDYRRGIIEWLAGPPAIDDGDALALEPDRGRFVVRIGTGQRELRLVPDSGAISLLLVQRAGQPLPAMSLSREATGLSTLSGQGRVRRGVVHELRVGDRRLRNVPAMIIDETDAAGSTDGLLPLHLFERVTFDRGRLIVEGARPA